MCQIIIERKKKSFLALPILQIWPDLSTVYNFMLIFEWRILILGLNLIFERVFLSSPIACIACEWTELLRTKIVRKMGPFSFVTLVLLGVGFLGFLGVPWDMYTYGMYTYGMYTYGMYTYGIFFTIFFTNFIDEFFDFFLTIFLTYILMNFMTIFLSNFLASFFGNLIMNYFWRVFWWNFWSIFLTKFLLKFLTIFLSFNHCEL